MDARAQIESCQSRIDDLNAKKGDLLRAQAGAQALLGADSENVSPEIRGINRQLYELYELKNSLLKNNPQLEAQYGKPGTTKKAIHLPAHWVITDSTRIARDREARRKNIHPRFKEWCQLQKRPIKYSLENWEDQANNARFLFWLADREVEQQEAQRNSVSKPIMDTATHNPPDQLNNKSELLRRFAGTMMAAELVPKNDKELTELLNDADFRFLYNEWCLEQKAA